MRSLLALLFLLLIVLAVVGYFRGWFFVSTADDLRRDEVNVNVKVDTEKVKEDVDAARKSARELGNDANKALKETTGADTVKGTVSDVRPDQFSVKQDDGMVVTILRNGATKSATDNAAAELKVGDRVRVDCIDQNGQRAARAINIERSTPQ
jgi:ribosomal protein S1